MKRALPQRHIEEAESRIQRGQRNVDHQRKTVSDLERDNQDATIATALLGMFEKALAGHVADRDQLLKELAERKAALTDEGRRLARKGRQ
jgi:hypothetical protein